MRSILAVFVLCGLAECSNSAQFGGKAKAVGKGTVSPTEETLPPTPGAATSDEVAQVAPGPTLAPLCALAYPFASSNPKTNINFNESTILTGYMPAIAGPDSIIKAFYVDEHSLTLGKNSGTFAVSPCNCDASPDSVADPSIGDPNAVDSAGRPIYPALFITDITADPKSTSGDWQNGGTPVPPTAVLGTWKALGAKNPATYNEYNVGNGDVVPLTTDAHDLTRPVFSAEVQWDVKKLNLPAGRIFRMQFMLHDGDREADAGEGCATVSTQ